MQALLLAALATPLAFLLRQGMGLRRLPLCYAAVVYLGFLQPVGKTGLGLPIGTLAVGLLIAYLGLRAVVRKVELRPLYIQWFLLGIISWALLGGLVHGSLHSGLLEIVTLLALVTTPLLLEPLAAPEVRRIQLAMGAGGIVNAAAAALQEAGAPTLFGLLEGLSPSYAEGLAGRVTGLQLNPNAGALFMVIGLVACFYLSASFHRQMHGIAWFWAAGGMACAWGVVATGSRAAAGSIVILAVLQLSKLGRSKVRVWIAVAAVLSIGAIVVLAPSIAERIELPPRTDGLTLDLPRKELWAIAAHGIEEDPLFGVHDSTGIRVSRNLHNDLAQMSWEFGLPAAMMFLSLLVALMVTLSRRWATRPLSFEAMAFETMAALVPVTLTHTFLLSGISLWLVVGYAVKRCATSMDVAERPGPGTTASV